MFDTKELEAALNSGQIKIPDNHKTVLVVHVDPINGSATATVGVNLGKGWELGNTIAWDKEEGMSDGFNLSFSR